MTVLLDNDVALKTCRYGLVSATIAALSDGGAATMLGSARFVLKGRLKRRPGPAHPERSLAELEALLNVVVTLEPTEDETLLAADMQEAAQRLGLPLDGGESQLLAVVLRRAGALMLTGDKRAIGASETVLKEIGSVRDAEGRLACLEQMLASLAAQLGHDVARDAICSDGGADATLTICYACHADGCSQAECLAGLESYQAALRAAAPTLLAPGRDLTEWLTSGRRHKAS